MKIREDYGHEWSEEGDIAFVENRLELARKAYIEASKYAPENPFIIYKIGRTMKALKNNSEADYYFKRALKIKPDLNEEIFIQRDNELKETLNQKQVTKTPIKNENSHVEGEHKNEKKAQDKFTEKKHENKMIDVRTLLIEGDKLSDNGNYTEALEKYRICQNEDPANPSIIARVSAMSSRLGNYDLAEESVEKIKHTSSISKIKKSSEKNGWWSKLLPSKKIKSAPKKDTALKKPKNITIEMIEEEIDKAINLINSQLPGADIGRSKNLLTFSGKSLKEGNLQDSFNNAIQAQLAANPNTEYLLNNAQKADHNAQTAFRNSDFQNAIQNWNITLDNYKLAEELARARNQRDDLNTIGLLIEKTRKNIENGRKSDQNRKMNELIMKGNSSIKEGDVFFKKLQYLEAISRYNEANQIFIEALDIAGKESFPANDEIQISIETIHESIKASHFGYVDLMLKNAEKDIDNYPERVESQYFAAVQYLQKLSYTSEENHSQLLTAANDGLIKSKILQAGQRIDLCKKFLDNREFHNAKENYRSILEYLNSIYDEALDLKFYQYTEDIKRLISVCNNNIERARSSMLQINEVEVSFKSPNEILRGQAKYEGGILKSSNPSNNVSQISSNGSNVPDKLFSMYSDVELIASGGFGKVYRVKRNDGQIAAVKIPSNLDPESGNIFLREVENWTKIDKHINVVSIYDYNIVPFPYIEMEYCDNSLADLPKPVEPLMAAKYIFDLCEGLKIAHRKNIIHRDLKPQNVLLKDNSVRIADWGLSKALSDASSSITREIKGTIKYAAPEQLDNKSKDGRTDIWQVGVLFYELLTGVLPFSGDGFSEIASSIYSKNPVLPSEYNPNLEEFNNIVLKCLEKNPENRYRTVEELQKDLAAYLSISYSISFEKSITQKDIRTSAIFCTDLLITHLKINNLQKAYYYCDDLLLLIKGSDKKIVEKLKNQILIRIEERFEDAPEELILTAERLYDQISLGTLGTERKIREGQLKFGNEKADSIYSYDLFE